MIRLSLNGNVREVAFSQPTFMLGQRRLLLPVQKEVQVLNGDKWATVAVEQNHAYFEINKDSLIDPASKKIYTPGAELIPEGCVPAYGHLMASTGTSIGMTSLDQPIYGFSAIQFDQILLANGVVVGEVIYE